MIFLHYINVFSFYWVSLQLFCLARRSRAVEVSV